MVRLGDERGGRFREHEGELSVDLLVGVLVGLTRGNVLEWEQTTCKRLNRKVGEKVEDETFILLTVPFMEIGLQEGHRWF